MSEQGEVVSVNVSREKGTPKTPVPEALIGLLGLEGDAHAGPGNRQVSLLGEESMARFTAKTSRAVQPGEFAENLTLRGLDLTRAVPLDRLRVGPVQLEVTQLGKACHGQGCAIFRAVGQCVMPTEGLFCRVLAGGPVRAGLPVVREPKTLRGLLITLSDRAARGEYSDRSGPRARELLQEFGRSLPWPLELESRLMPDDAGRLREELLAARGRRVDFVCTLGSTGLGPRDIAPETAAAVCDKLIPGVMEAIRLKHGAANPRALLSRSVAGLAGETLVYTLPGSVRAVEEYLAEIMPTLQHAVLMVHGVDVH